MRSLLILSFFIVCFSLYANTEEEALRLFSDRYENSKNAFSAYETYKKLATNSTANAKKISNLYISASESVYYYSGQLDKDENKKKLALFNEGMNMALKAAGLLVGNSPDVARKVELKTNLARAYYYYSANLGKWGEAKGVLSSLGKWPTLKKHLNYILDLDETVEDYGAFRVLGRAFMKIPYESNANSFKYLKFAYEKTLTQIEDIEISSNSTTVLYYLDILKKQDKIDIFCNLYEDFEFISTSNYEIIKSYGHQRYPETMNDIKSFSNNKDLQTYYDDNC